MMALLQQAYRNACLAELEALKPGNVHVFADGHGMQVQDFVDSAEVSAPALCDDQLLGQRTLGQRILQALQATHAKVGCNTNLGIILLAAPVVQACLQSPQQPLATAIQQVCQQSTLDDATQVYAGIRVVSPAGMGQRDEHDVSQPPQITLMQAMQIASPVDMIARQYVEGFREIFDAAMPLYETCLQRWQRPAWALTAVYLYWLSSTPDSHIARKFGDIVAQSIQHEAGDYYQSLLALENPKQAMPALLVWDQKLKAQRINPGTSADLTVITAMLAALRAHQPTLF